jgi:prepilin-type N-terminal cleavage/methylation domain-containing protein
MRRGQPSGFTLIEVLGVMAIVALLAALLLGLAAHAQQTAARKKAIAELAQLEGFITDFRMKYGQVPIHRHALANALRAENHRLAGLHDPWGPQYYYVRSSPMTFYLWSRGGQRDFTPGDDDRSLYIGHPDPRF